MSLFASFSKKSKLDKAVKKAAEAYKNNANNSDEVLKQVYQDYADVMSGDALRAETLYHWGVTLLRQAKHLSPPESVNVYRNAIAKFSFCMTIEPNYLAAAIDAGVACMDLARARGVPATDELYHMAKRQFEKANSIQAGVAAFNLACVYGIWSDNEGCLEMLNIAKQKGNLPDDAEIVADPDLANIVNQQWFKDFMVTLVDDRKIAEEKRLAAKAAAEEAKKPKPKDPNVFDPYHTPAAKPDKQATSAEKNESADKTDTLVEPPKASSPHVQAPPKEVGQTPVAEETGTAAE